MNARPAGMLGLAMCCAAMLAWLLRPKYYADPLPKPLNDLVPRNFGDWRSVESGPAVIDPAREALGGELNAENPYDDVLMRSYTNSDGEVVQLAMAYGHNQRQEVKLHRPELCYTAQGFHVRSVSRAQFFGIASSEQAISGVRMLTEAPGRVEAVSYWMRVGGLYTDSAWAIRYHILKEGLAGHVDDGLLVRASQVVTGSSTGLNASYALQSGFLAALVAALPPDSRRALVR